MSPLREASTKAEKRRLTAPSDNWRINRRLTATWDWIVKHRSVAFAYHLVLFFSDSRVMNRHMAGIGRFPAGTSVLDVPCGSGTLFHDLLPSHQYRYVAGDISVLMLQRAKKEAAARGLDWVTFKKLDVSAITEPDGSFDVVATYAGLHCFPDPRRALLEMGRVLRAGGVLRGSVLVTGRGLVPDASIRFWRRARIFDVEMTQDDILRWLEEAGIRDVKTERSGAWLCFEGSRVAGR